MNYSTAQKNLLAKAQEALALGKEETALFLAQGLLRTAPSLLEARQVARQAVSLLETQQKEKFFKKILKKGKGIFLLGKIKLLMIKKEPLAALVVLEKLIELKPHWLIAHRWMAQVALQNNPPLHDLALFSMEESVKLAPHNKAAHLELAREALYSKPYGKTNPTRALEAYQAVLSIDPNHLEAKTGMKNALAVMALQDES